MTGGLALRRFEPGETIVHRSVDARAGIVMTAFPQIAVRDDPDLIATYMPAGVIGKRRSGKRGGGPRGRQLVRWDGGHEDRPWTGTNVLMLHRPGDPFSLWSAWDAADWRHVWWYVNLEDPWRRTLLGFDSRDHDLDLWAEPEASGWHVKDEDELLWSASQGRYTDAEVARIRSEAERALERVSRREPPFDEAWASWRPDASWSLPVLPDSWREPP